MAGPTVENAANRRDSKPAVRFDDQAVPIALAFDTSDLVTTVAPHTARRPARDIDVSAFLTAVAAVESETLVDSRELPVPHAMDVVTTVQPPDALEVLRKMAAFPEPFAPHSIATSEPPTPAPSSAVSAVASPSEQAGASVGSWSRRRRWLVVAGAAAAVVLAVLVAIGWGSRASSTSSPPPSDTQVETAKPARNTDPTTPASGPVARDAPVIQHKQTAPAPNKRGCSIESPTGLAGGLPLMLLGLLGRRIRRGAKR